MIFEIDAGIASHNFHYPHIGQADEPSARAYHDFGEKVVQISGTSHSDRDHYCVLTESSRIYCWGYGADGGNLRSSTNNIGLNEAVTDTPPLKVWDNTDPIVSGTRSKSSRQSRVFTNN